jgi:uncharacterized protein YdhG (YjbR/CyaY superfamily)
MVAQKLKPSTIEEYINAAPAAVQEKLWQLHECISKAAPGATEGLKWRIPAYSYQKIMVTFAVFKNHIGFYPMETALQAFAKKLANYKTARGSVQFPLDKPLPLSLINKIVRFRVKESVSGNIKWKS